ncbi:hypothetical protein [Hoeflea sp.]|uniref:hypothetical protein n=1 Tax=Hoeflea sp. TaxID=1940281 RepID=UPI003B022AF3
MTLLASVALFVIFFANVLVGAVTGSPIFGDVAEMLVLFAASILFVAAILRSEADARNQEKQ